MCEVQDKTPWSLVILTEDQNSSNWRHIQSSKCFSQEYSSPSQLLRQSFVVLHLRQYWMLWPTWSRIASLLYWTLFPKMPSRVSLHLVSLNFPKLFFSCRARKYTYHTVDVDHHLPQANNEASITQVLLASFRLPSQHSTLAPFKDFTGPSRHHSSTLSQLSHKSNISSQTQL